MKKLTTKISNITNRVFNENNHIYLICSTILITSLCFSLLTFFIFSGDTIRLYFGSIPGDQFGDIFNTINGINSYGLLHVYDNPLYSTASYPPFAIIILAFLSLFTPISDNDKLIYSSGFYYIILSYTFICILLIIFLLQKLMRQSNRRWRILFISLILISPSFIFLYLRGNLLLLNLVFILCFLYFYKSESKWKNEFALISLSLSIGIKIYPIVFCGLFVVDRRFKDLFKTAYYTVSIYFFSFMYLGGIDQVHNLINNMAYASSHFGQNSLLASPSTLLNFTNCFIIFFSTFGIDKTFLLSINNYFLYPLALIIALLSFFLKERWQMVYFYVFIAIMIPYYSWLYNAVMYAVPFIIFLLKKEYKKMDIIYATELSILFCSFVFVDGLLGHIETLENADLSITGYIYQVAQYILLFTIIGEWVYRRILSLIDSHKKAKQTLIQTSEEK